MPKRSCSIQDCDRPHNARGYCFGHYERWKKLGHPDAGRPLNTHVRPEATMLDRILRRIDPGLSDSECWPWRGALGGRKSRTGVGYGKFTVQGRQYDAHRVSWEIHNQRPVPDGLHILHTCDNPLCVNPRHLVAGTNDDNVCDMVSKRRHTFGERNPRAVLTEEAVADIRASALDRGALAEKYGVGRGTINDVIAHRAWAHVG